MFGKPGEVGDERKCQGSRAVDVWCPDEDDDASTIRDANDYGFWIW